jgi:DNA-binding NtrC family response regulator
MAKSSARSGGWRWARELANSSTPVYLLDRHRRVLLFNAGCTEKTGWAADEVIGKTCDYVTEADAHSAAAVLAALAPPAEVWQGSPAEIPILLPHRTDPPRNLRIRFDPLFDGEQQVRAALGAILETEAPPPAISPNPAQGLHAELAALRMEIRRRYRQESVIGKCPAMRRVLAQLDAARSGTGSILFLGEPGSGREHLARVLHAGGSQGKRAFVPMDCGRMASTELKRILKSLDEGQTEVDALQPGTLYLDDIAAAPRDFQDRLSDWLANRPLDRLPRIMAAAVEPLTGLLDRDEFHAELFYRLTTIVIELPPLRRRSADILPLAQYFLEETNISAERQHSGFTPEAADELRRYRWPGNVAELREVVESAAAQAAGPLVAPDDFPLSFRAGRDEQRLGPPPRPPVLPLETVLEQVEREQIQAALIASRNNLSKAAELLGLSRPKLYRRLEALGLGSADSQ